MERTVLRVRVNRHEEGAEGYFAVCLDLEGCHASGQTVVEALEKLQDAAQLVLQRQKEHDSPSTTVEAHHEEELFGNIAVPGPNGREIVLRVSIRPHAFGEPGFFAVTPELQGCHSIGDTLGQALFKIQDAAAMVLDFRKEQDFADTQGESLPEELTGYVAVET